MIREYIGIIEVLLLLLLLFPVTDIPHWWDINTRQVTFVDITKGRQFLREGESAPKTLLEISMLISEHSL